MIRPTTAAAIAAIGLIAALFSIRRSDLITHEPDNTPAHTAPTPQAEANTPPVDEQPITATPS